MCDFCIELSSPKCPVGVCVCMCGCAAAVRCLLENEFGHMHTAQLIIDDTYWRRPPGIRRPFCTRDGRIMETATELLPNTFHVLQVIWYAGAHQLQWRRWRRTHRKCYVRSFFSSSFFSRQFRLRAPLCPSHRLMFAFSLHFFFFKKMNFFLSISHFVENEPLHVPKLPNTREKRPKIKF